MWDWNTISLVPKYMCGNSHCMLSGDCGTDSMICPKPWFAWETPRFWRVFNLGFSHNVCPNLVLMNFEKPYRPRVLGVKNLLLNKYPKILTCVKPGIFIQCRPKVFALVENPKILTSQVGLGCFVSKNMVLITKYTKILTGVKPGILIWC